MRYVDEQPDPAAFAELYATTGWRDDATPALLERALAGCWAVCSVYDGDDLVGFGRVISDGALHAFVTEMIVAPAYHGRGIGSAILRRLVDRCQCAGIADIQLFCAEGFEGFYRRHGFEPRPPDAPGMQFIRNS